MVTQNCINTYSTYSSTTGEIKPNQPAYGATLTNNALNITGDGTAYTVAGFTEWYDIGSDFASATGIYTAPVDCMFYFSGNFYGNGGLTAAHTKTEIKVVTSNRTYVNNSFSWQFYEKSGFGSYFWTVIADMDAADTATYTYTVYNGTKTVDLFAARTYVQGIFIC